MWPLMMVEPPVPTGWLLITEAANRLVDGRMPDLRQRVAQNSLELLMLRSRSAAKRPRSNGSLLSGRLNPLLDSRQAEQWRRVELQRESDQLDLESELARRDLHQQFCDCPPFSYDAWRRPHAGTGLPTWLLSDVPGDPLTIDPSYWHTTDSVSARSTNTVSLVTVHGVIRGRAVLRLAHFNQRFSPEASAHGEADLATPADATRVTASGPRADLDQAAGADPPDMEKPTEVQDPVNHKEVADVAADEPPLMPDTVIRPELLREWEERLQDLTSRLRNADALAPRDEFLNAAKDVLQGCLDTQARELYVTHIQAADLAARGHRPRREDAPKIQRGRDVLLAWMAVWLAPRAE